MPTSGPPTPLQVIEALWCMRGGDDARLVALTRQFGVKLPGGLAWRCVYRSSYPGAKRLGSRVNTPLRWWRCPAASSASSCRVG